MKVNLDDQASNQSVQGNLYTALKFVQLLEFADRKSYPGIPIDHLVVNHTPQWLCRRRRNMM